MSSDEKQGLRYAVWHRLQDAGVARFPFPVEGRIPNFEGAAEAVGGLTRQSFYQQAAVLKCNPDSPQRPLRIRALADGKTVYMALPRLRDRRCFLELEPERIPGRDRAAAVSVSSCQEYGKPVAPGDLPRVDLVSVGSVAVSEHGERIGKGGGYSDLEFALGREYGFVDDRTVVVTTVHELQVVGQTWAPEDHDVPLDWVFTPGRPIRCSGGRARPRGIDWSLVDDEMLAAIPALRDLRPV